MRGKGHRVILLAPPESEIYERFTREGFEAHAFGFQKMARWRELPQLISLFRRMKPDVVGTHSYGDSWAALPAARVARVPVVLRYRHISAPVRGHILNRLLYGRACDHVLTTAECIRTDLIRNLRLGPAKISTIPTGIEPPYFTATREEERVALGQELNLPPAARFIGCVAVLRSWKGQEFLLRAFDAIAEEFPAHHLLLIGEGPYRSFLEETRRTLRAAERIHLLGHRDDPWKYFRAMDAALLASYKDEGIPQSLLQAMFAECPVIGSAVGGIPEIIVHQETGLLVGPKSVPELSQGIATTLQFPEEAQHRARRALEYVRVNHTLEGMGNRILRLIHQIKGGDEMQRRESTENTA